MAEKLRLSKFQTTVLSCLIKLWLLSFIHCQELKWHATVTECAQKHLAIRFRNNIIFTAKGFRLLFARYFTNISTQLTFPPFEHFLEQCACFKIKYKLRTINLQNNLYYFPIQHSQVNLQNDKYMTHLIKRKRIFGSILFVINFHKYTTSNRFDINHCMYMDFSEQPCYYHKTIVCINILLIASEFCKKKICDLFSYWNTLLR